MSVNAEQLKNYLIGRWASDTNESAYMRAKTNRTNEYVFTRTNRIYMYVRSPLGYPAMIKQGIYSIKTYSIGNTILDTFEIKTYAIGSTRFSDYVVSDISGDFSAMVVYADNSPPKATWKKISGDDMKL